MSTAGEVEGGKKKHGCLCALLGMLFGPVGLIIDAIIAGASGVVAGLLGMLVPTLIGIAVFVLVLASEGGY